MASHNVPQTRASQGVSFNREHSGKGEAVEGDVDTKMNSLCIGVQGDGKRGGGGALDVDGDREGKVAKREDTFGGERGGHEEGEGIEMEKGEGKCRVAKEEK